MQVVAIGYARFTPSRFFCWAPYDQLNVYSLHVTLGSSVLSQEEAVRRYRLRGYPRENRSIEHLFQIIRQYESTYGAGDSARVVVRYVTNGHPEKIWTYPSES